MQRVLLISLLSAVFVGCSCTGINKQLDPEPAAVTANDFTALIAIESDGCGFEPMESRNIGKKVRIFSGFLVCRKTEGSTANEFVYFVAPDVTCSGSLPCVEFKIFYPTGEPAYGGSITRRQTRVGVPWRELLHRDQFQKGDRGLWGFSYSIRYTGPDGIDRTMYSQGEVYLRVIPKEYLSLSTIFDEPTFYWAWNEDGTTIKMTTGARTFVDKKWLP